MKVDRRCFLAGAAAASASLTLSSAGLAKAPFAGTQAPGFYRMKVGGFEVTALLDGYFDLDLTQFPAADPGQAAELAARAFLPPGPLRTPVNAYLVNTGEQLVLVDAGTAQKLGPTLGRLDANLRAAGVDPGQVDLVLFTHLHPDHVNGILTADGKAAFPKAELVVAEAEWAFWTPPEALAQAPDAMKPFFQMAQDAVKPYGGRVTRFEGEKEVVPGITSIPAPGHTPGHTAYRVVSGANQLLIWGDVVHAAALQFTRPEWAIAFDVDQAQAVATRQRLFDVAATDRVAVVGMHLPFPGHGHVARSGSTYAFVPAPYAAAL